MVNNKLIAKNASIIFIGVLLAKPINFLLKIIMTRFLGPEKFGIYTLSFAIFSIITMITLIGLPVAIPRLVAYYAGKKQLHKVKTLIRNSIFIVLCLSIFLSILVFLLADQIALLFGNTLLTPLIQLFAFAIPFYTIYTITQKAIEGLKKVRYSTIAELVLNIIRAVAISAALFLGYKLFGVVIAYIITTILALLLSFYFLNTKVLNIIQTTPTKNLYKNILKFTLPLSVMNFSNSVLSWVDTLIIGYFLIEAQIGIYNVAITLAGLVVIFLSATQAALTPLLTEEYAKNKTKQLKETYKLMSFWLFLIISPLILLMYALPNELLSLFGQPFTAGITSFLILIFGFLLTATFGQAGPILLSIGKPKVLMFNALTTIIVDVILNILLIPKYGIAGAALATTLAFLFINTLRIIEVKYFLDVLPFSKKLFSSVILLGLALISFYYLTPLLNLINKIGVLCVITLFYGLITYYLIMQAQDRRFIGKLLTKGLVVLRLKK